MKFLVTGATGYLGSRVVQTLLRRRHEVVGLVRTVEAAERLRAAGIEATLGDLAQPSSFRAAAVSADGTIHTAFGHGIDFMAAVAEERSAIAALIETYAGTGKRLVVSTATGVVGDTGPMPVDESFAGQPDFPARVRMGVEADLKAAAGRGVHAVVVRPAIFVHGHGASQFVPMLVAIARQHGEAGYLGDGGNRIATVHVDDLAELFVLAAENGAAGALYNGAGADISTAELATAIATGNQGVAARSYTSERAAEVWGPFPAMLLGINNRASGDYARSSLGWRPYMCTPHLAADLATGSYANQTVAVAK
jgi:nucleoside-diphosphate-sugar epimerase